MGRCGRIGPLEVRAGLGGPAGQTHRCGGTPTARSGRPCTLNPARFVVAGGLLVNHTPELRQMFDVRVYLPPEELRRRWKVARDCSRRGYSTGQVLSELDRRERDSGAFIRPQRHPTWSSFMPGRSQDPDQLDAQLFPIDSLPHPDPSEVVGDGAGDDLCWDLLTRADAVAVTARGTGVASRRRSHADGPTYRRRCPPGCPRGHRL